MSWDLNAEGEHHGPYQKSLNRVTLVVVVAFVLVYCWKADQPGLYVP